MFYCWFQHSNVWNCFIPQVCWRKWVYLHSHLNNHSLRCNNKVDYAWGCWVNGKKKDSDEIIEITHFNVFYLWFYLNRQLWFNNAISVTANLTFNSLYCNFTWMSLSLGDVCLKTTIRIRCLFNCLIYDMSAYIFFYKLKIAFIFRYISKSSSYPRQ